MESKKKQQQPKLIDTENRLVDVRGRNGGQAGIGVREMGEGG